MIKTAHINILESSAVALSSGGEDARHPLWRLYDRDIGRAFRASSAGTLEVMVDQGAAGAQAVDRLLIPGGHNLAGTALSLEHSDDSRVWTPAVAAWTGEDGLIDKPFTSAAKRYWRFRAANPEPPPEFAELFLTSTTEWEGGPPELAGTLEDLMNTENLTTASGRDRFLVHGAPRRRRGYAVARCGEALKVAVLSLYGAVQGAKPFWLCDHKGEWIFGRLAGPLDLKASAERGYVMPYSFSFNFLEVLP